MEWEFVLGLGTITLATIALVIYFGRKLSIAVQDQAPESDLAATVTPTGTALAAGVIGCWVACLAVRELEPETRLGVVLSNTDGVILVAVAPVFIIALAAAILDKFGYPAMKRGGRGAR